MSIFSIFKRDKKEVIKLDRPTQGPSNIQAINHHKVRIENLMDEYMIISKDLKSVQQNNEELKSIKNKKIDSIIFRMAIIKYEVDIRKDHLKWLCS